MCFQTNSLNPLRSHKCMSRADNIGNGVNCSVMHSLALLGLFLKTVNCFSFRTIPNHVYTGVISHTIHGVDWLNCLDACSRRGNCVSYNFKQRLHNEDENSICYLFDSLDYNECDSEGTSFLVYETGFIFHQIRTNIKVPPCTEQDQQKGTTTVFADCYEVLLAGQTQSGVYTITPDGQAEFDVFCDQSTRGGGWTVFQRRFDGSVDFYQKWKSYKIGFGNLTGEFWLGLDNIYRLTSAKNNTLRVDLGDFNHTSLYAEYDLFKVLDENDSYAIQLENYTGTAGDSLMWHNSMPFSTNDRDYGDCSAGNCAVLYHGAWWYGDSFRSNLNGKYYAQDTPSFDGIIWEKWRGGLMMTSLKKTEMKVRPYI